MAYPTGRETQRRHSNADGDYDRTRNQPHQYSHEFSTQRSSNVVYHHKDTLPQQSIQHTRSNASYHSPQSNDQRGHHLTPYTPRRPSHYSLPYSRRVSSGPHNPDHQARPPVPAITDAVTFAEAVRLEPDKMFRNLRQVIEERDTLRVQVSSLTEDNKNIRKDYLSAWANYEKLADIWRQKHILLWRFIERMQNGVGEESCKKYDEWVVGGKEDRRSMMKDGDEELDHDVVIEEEEERGRSRVAKTPHLAASDVISFNETATEAGGSASITFSMSVEGSIGDATEDTSIKLDPSAAPFEPSPTRVEKERQDLQSSFLVPCNEEHFPPLPPPIQPSIESTASIMPLANLIPVENPWIEVKSRKSGAIEAQTRKPNQQVATAKKSSSVACDKTRGGRRPRHDPEPLSQNSPNHKNSKKGGLLFSKPKSWNKEFKTDWRTREIDQGGLPTQRNHKNPWGLKDHKTKDQRGQEKVEPEGHPEQGQRKVSPEVTRIANLPPYPISHSQSQSMADVKSSEIPPVLPTTPPNDNEITSAPQDSQASSSSIISKAMRASIPPHLFMTRARLQATLNSISPPFDKICPVSLLSGRPCHIDGCELLQVCPNLNDRSLNKVEDDEYPALGVSNTTNVPLAKRSSNECSSLPLPTHNKNDASQLFCSGGHICVLPSCKDEVDEKICVWRTNKAALKHSGRKFHALDWKHDHSAASHAPKNPLGPMEAVQAEAARKAGIHSSAPLDSPVNHAAPLFTPTSNSVALVGPGENRYTANHHSNHSIRLQKSVEEKEFHLKSYVHERDGVRKDEWHARVTNASLRAMHEGGLWGVAGIHIEGEDESIGASTAFQ